MTSVQYRQNLLARTFLGFDREAFMEDGDKYPRYNIVREESADRVSVEIAVPGFGKDDVSVEQDGNKLIIKAKPVDWLEDGEEYLHKGFSSKAFEKDFDEFFSIFQILHFQKLVFSDPGNHVNFKL